MINILVVEDDGKLNHMDEFWGMDSDTSLRAVDVYVTKR